MVKIHCKKECGFTDEYEPTEFGLDYYEAIGTCPNCESPMVNEQGEETARVVTFHVVEQCP
jgi:hypothetical protein